MELPHWLEHTRQELQRVSFVSGIPFDTCVKAFVAHSDALMASISKDTDAPRASLDSAADAMAAAVGVDTAYRFQLAWNSDSVLDDDPNLLDQAHYERVQLDKWFNARRQGPATVVNLDRHRERLRAVRGERANNVRLMVRTLLDRIEARNITYQEAEDLTRAILAGLVGAP